jgi:type III restriction enzyme
MRLNKAKAQIEFPFYIYLKMFHDQERKKIYSAYKPLTRKFLSYNNPENPTAFLRPPQFQALEIYIFLKEFLENRYLHQIFEDWYHKRELFTNRQDIGISLKTGTYDMFGPSEFQTEDREQFRIIFNHIKGFKQVYSNYIYALTMGLGKTILMATCIFYEFLLANKYPEDKKYCHNALVFAPDKTVLQSLKEIETFDKAKVIPQEYINWLDTHLKFHYLDDSGISLNAIENSKYNIIISNTQKIILKRQHKDKSASQKLFDDYEAAYKALSLNKDYEDLYGFTIDTEQDLTTNQRFAKLTRLPQLGIYADEAHHVFGNKLAADFGIGKTTTSLRLTINELAENLEKAGTHVVACYNYTGTPYVNNQLLPEVVYAYGLREAIDNKFLKKVSIHGFQNVREQDRAFLRNAIQEFWKHFGEKRYEGMLPKMAIFATTIEELTKEVRPIVEDILAEMDISLDKILVNVGDDKITSNDDLREFKNLDTPHSDKQFILLVNKGKEGWNCRSLFSVTLHRLPDSRVFVLQATMRCLRSIGEVQETALVYLSKENVDILDKELQENFKITIDDFKNAGDNRKTYQIRTVPPPVKIKLKRIRKLHMLEEKTIKEGIKLGLDEVDTEKYKIIETVQDIRDLEGRTHKVDVSHIKERRSFSELTLVAEISRYLNKSPLNIQNVLASTEEGTDKILKAINEYNELLYDWLIPKLFTIFYDLREYEAKEEEEIELVREPKEGYYQVKGDEELTANIEDAAFEPYKAKSFHLDHYCFDSKPENTMFWTLLKDHKIKKVWFTGMLTHGQTDFVINYIDPESHTVRCYYPDFLVQKEDGTYVIVEVKGDNKIDDTVVKAKAEYARQIASASEMTYKIIKGSEAEKGVGIN